MFSLAGEIDCVDRRSDNFSFDYAGSIISELPKSASFHCLPIDKIWLADRGRLLGGESLSHKSYCPAIRVIRATIGFEVPKKRYATEEPRLRPVAAEAARFDGTQAA